MELFRDDVSFEDLGIIPNALDSIAADLELLENTLHPVHFNLFAEELNSYMDGVLKKKQLKFLTQNYNCARTIRNEALIAEYQCAINEVMMHGPNPDFTRINIAVNEVAAPSENNYSVRSQSDVVVPQEHKENSVPREHKENSVALDIPYDSVVFVNPTKKRKPRHPLLQKQDDYMAPLISKPRLSTTRCIEPVLQNSQVASQSCSEVSTTTPTVRRGISRNNSERDASRIDSTFASVDPQQNTNTSQWRARKRIIRPDFSDSSGSEFEESHIATEKRTCVEEERNSSDSASDNSTGSPIIRPSTSKIAKPAEHKKSKSKVQDQRLKSAPPKERVTNPKAKSTNKKAGKKNPVTVQKSVPAVFVDTFNSTADFENGQTKNDSCQDIGVTETAQSSKSNKRVTKKREPAPKKPPGGKKKLATEAGSSSMVDNFNSNSDFENGQSKNDSCQNIGVTETAQSSKSNKRVTKKRDPAPKKPPGGKKKILTETESPAIGPTVKDKETTNKNKKRTAAKKIAEKKPTARKGEENRTIKKTTVNKSPTEQKTNKAEKKVTNKSQKRKSTSEKEESVLQKKKPHPKKKAPSKEKEKDGTLDEHENIPEPEGPSSKKAKNPRKVKAEKQNKKNEPKEKSLPKKDKKGGEKKSSPIEEKENEGKTQDTDSDFDSDSDDSLFENGNYSKFSINRCLLSAKKDAPLINGSVTPQMIGVRMRSFDLESDDNLSVVSASFRGADKFVANRMAKANKPKQPKSFVPPVVGNPKVSDLLAAIHKKGGRSVTPKMVKKLFKPRVQERGSSSVESSESSNED